MKFTAVFLAAVASCALLFSSSATASPVTQLDLLLAKRGIRTFCGSFTGTCGKLCGSTGTIVSTCKQINANTFDFGCQCNGGAWQTANTINTILGYNAQVKTVTATQTDFIATKTKTVTATYTPSTVNDAVQKRATSAQNFCASYNNQCSLNCQAKNSTPANNSCTRIGTQPDYYQVTCTCMSGNIRTQHTLNDMVTNAPQDTYTTTTVTLSKTLTTTSTKSVAAAPTV